MSTWLRLLPLEIADVQDLIEPIGPIKEGETIVGVVSDNLRKVWTLYNSLKKSAELLTVELRYAPASTEGRGRASELTAKARALELLFWIGVIDELEIWGHPEQCGLRVGWQVVEFKQQVMQFPFGFLPGS